VTINSLNYNVSTPVTGLGSQTFNATQAGLTTVAFNFTIPYIASGTSGNSTVTTGQSGLQVVVNQNGTPVLTSGGTSSNPSPYQASLAGQVVINCAVNDVITVVLSSANAVDAVPNAVKGIINIFQGPL
jgi:hypothetical protein